MNNNYLEKINIKNLDILNELKKLPFPFYVYGGLTNLFFLKEHARATKDIDILFNFDIKEVEDILKKHFDVLYFHHQLPGINSFEESFSCLIKYKDEEILIDGSKRSYFDEIKTKEYFLGDISFIGVDFNFAIADKIMANTNELIKPYKHLVDLYTISFLPISTYQIKEIIHYMNIINNHDNKMRKIILNKNNLPLSFSIDENKEYKGSLILSTIQAKYNLNKEYMLIDINKFLKKVSKYQ